MVSKIFIVDAGPVHAEMIAELHWRSFRRGWSVEECAALLADPRIVGLLALMCGWLRTQPAGFVLAREAAGEAEILSIGVAPNARGRGVGRMLLAAAIERLRHRGTSDLFLEVEETNLPAVSLYRAFGFRERGRRESYYRSDGPRPAAALILHRAIESEFG